MRDKVFNLKPIKTMQKLYFKDLKTDNIEIYLGDKKVADAVRNREVFNYSVTIVESKKTFVVGALPAILSTVKKELKDSGVDV
jgi:hypothetical protein